MSEHREPQGLTDEELAAETGTALPDKEVVSILDLNADLDLAIDAAAPIDLGVAANANVAAPIDAAVGANVLSEGSTAQAMADQGARDQPERRGRRDRQRHPGQHHGAGRLARRLRRHRPGHHGRGRPDRPGVATDPRPRPTRSATYRAGSPTGPPTAWATRSAAPSATPGAPWASRAVPWAA